jgi:hypothetical protein
MKNVFVKKKSGIGYTVNMRSRAGKITTAVFTVVTVGLLAWLLVPMFTGYSITLTVSGHQVEIRTSAIGGPFTFAAGDIQSVTMLNEFPSARRIIGTGTTNFYSGRFNVTGYGTSNVYIHRNSPPYIAIELTEGWVFVNGKTQGETQGFYQRINAANR